VEAPENAGAEKLVATRKECQNLIANQVASTHWRHHW
jgi:hypothetical protein